MPFWWNRRKKWWRGRRRPFYKRRFQYKRRKPRRRVYRKKHRRTYRRGRKRFKKVRRKKKQLPITQWQPQAIRKCKIKGTAINVLGVQGTQYRCYTNNKYEYTISKAPGGGGFGVEKYSLGYLYKEHRAGNNIWTSSNVNLDLVRYTGCTFKFYRHPHIDFIGTYSRNYPMDLQKYTYADSHPYQILQSKHKFLVPSMKTKPKGKRYVKVRIKPPRQMVNKWFFQESFSDTGLLQLHTAAADLRYPHLGCCNTNQLAGFLHLNTDIYHNGAWGNPNNPVPTQQSKWYVPTPNFAAVTKVKNAKGDTVDITTCLTPYEKTISYKEGWFQPKFLQAIEILQPQQLNGPIKGARYNPSLDTGQGTAVWLTSVLTNEYGPPKTDLDLYLEGLPLWQLLLGFLDWVKQKKKDPTFLQSYYLCFHCNAIEPKPGIKQVFIPVDYSFIMGKGAYDSILSVWDQSHWYPLLKHQLQTINALVSTGPFIPKLDTIKDSTWELYSEYIFYFKFGGAALPDAETKDPATQGSHDVPDRLTKKIQVLNPQKNIAAAALHSWDYRRGIITSTAYKRMCENAETDSDFTADVPRKKKKTSLQGNSLPIISKEAEEVQSCLQSLYEESIFQEIPQEKTIEQLLREQQQQQHHIKNNLLLLINNLKKKQKLLQLQTGILD
nr:MAG: ORF1 [Torque teno midi virus]